MFKLKEFHNDKNDFGFAMQVMNPWETCRDEKPHCLYNIKFGKYSWWWHGPELFKPRTTWVDLEHCKWASVGPNGKKGYHEEIQRSYGFTCVPESGIHVHYGIQPGNWSRNDPENSDHTKVFNYFWNWEHIRHDAYDVSGTYLCDGTHLFHWKHEIDSRSYNNETRIEDFEKIADFIYPNEPNKNDKSIYRCEKYNNWSHVVVPGNIVYQHFDYIDPYDGMQTRAKVNIEERQWIRGKWKWLRSILRFIPGCNKIQRTMNIMFRDEVGPKKGSWKGGTVGMGYPISARESLSNCFNRFQKEYKHVN